LLSGGAAHWAATLIATTPPLGFVFKMRVQLVSIGYELLIGRVVNTNASWLSAEITRRGHTVERIVCVGDDAEWIGGELNNALSAGAKLIVTTGGLGPTFDDITAQSVAKALGRSLVKHPVAHRLVSEKYASLGLPLTPEREKMAMLPDGSTPLENPVGTAPGFMLSVSDARVVCLPGVPQEMQAMFLEHVDSFLPTAGELFERTLIVEGLPESSVAPIVGDIVTKNPYVYVKTHPRGSEGSSLIEVHLYTVSDNPRARELCAQLAEKLGRELAAMGGKVES
jgi:nicotinamide-nucleotide amidase